MLLTNQISTQNRVSTFKLTALSDLPNKTIPYSASYIVKYAIWRFQCLRICTKYGYSGYRWFYGKNRAGIIFIREENNFSLRFPKYKKIIFEVNDDSNGFRRGGDYSDCYLVLCLLRTEKWCFPAANQMYQIERIKRAIDLFCKAEHEFGLYMWYICNIRYFLCKHWKVVCEKLPLPFKLKNIL